MKVLKEELKELYENRINFLLYLAFPIVIYLFKINNKNKKDIVQNMSKVNKKGTRSNMWN